MEKRMKTSPGLLVVMLTLLLAAGPGIGLGAETARNPFMNTSQSTPPSDYALAVGLVRLHGLVVVGEQQQAILSCPDGASTQRAYHHVATGHSIQVAYDGKNYAFRVRLNSTGVTLTTNNQESYTLEL